MPTTQPPSRSLLGASVLSLLLSGCALPPSSRMEAPADIAPTAEVLDVAKRSRATGLLVDESFDVGAYQVRKVKRGAMSNSSFSIGPVSTASSEEGFSFQFHGSQSWQGRCALRAKDRFLQVKVLTLEDRHAELQCSCDSEKQSVSLQLADEGRQLRGEMAIGAARYTLLPYLFGNSDGSVRAKAVGYRVEQPGNGAGVAAVEVLYPGRIWQQRSLPTEQREPMACLMSGLMIYGLR